MNLTQIFATNNACYKVGTPMKPTGLMLHSTGANNPNLKRYVQPDDGLMGNNPYGNHFNVAYPGGRSVCVHGFIGKLADGSVATRQIMPWTMQAWHAGGSANNSYIGVEMCEDDLKDREYFLAVYREAVELFAYLCKEFNISPERIVSHKEGHAMGIAANHGDPDHWLAKHGKTMDDFRADVSAELEEEEMSYDKFKEYMLRYEAERGAKPEAKWSIDEGAFAKAQRKGVMDGTRPEDPIKRCEMAAVMDRVGLLDSLPDREDYV